MNFNTLEQLDLKDKNVFIRLDLNVPLNNGKIGDDTRIKAALPTLKKVIAEAKHVVIASHLGRPKGEKCPELSLLPVGEYLAELLDCEVAFVDDYTEEDLSQTLAQLDAGQCILLENLRFHEGETRNDPEFAKKLMSGIDVYINDAFGTAHRAHASVCAAAAFLPLSQRGAGLLIEKELKALTPLLKKVDAPFTAIVGGAKVSDKIGIILSLIERCDHLIIGGAMAYTLLEFKGIAVGSSRVEKDKLPLAGRIFEEAEKRKVQIHLPVDHVCAKEFSESAETMHTDDQTIPNGWMGLDIGEKSTQNFCDILAKSKTILWNGPMGVFEWEAFSRGTLELARAMAANEQAFTVIGGGDSVAAAQKAGVSEKISHISTGGGASLEFLEGKKLPGLQILAK